jgi:PII-like signaling protein
MKRTTKSLRLSLFLGEGDTWHHKPLYHEIVRRAREAGLAGATVLRGTEGYGSHSQVHTTRLLDLSEDLPLLVLIVDEPEKVRAFLPQLDELVEEGTVLLDEVEAIRYTKD